MLISTSGSGFNIFKPSLDEAASEGEDDEKEESINNIYHH
jgi:hypothetical protein